MRCDLDMTWNGAVCVNPNDPYGLLDRGLNSQKIIDNGKVKMGIIHHANGVYVFSLDGIHYYNTPESAKKPGLFTRAKYMVFSWFSWGSNGFFGGKSLDPDQKLMETIADNLLSEIKKNLSLLKSNLPISIQVLQEVFLIC